MRLNSIIGLVAGLASVAVAFPVNTDTPAEIKENTEPLSLSWPPARTEAESGKSIDRSVECVAPVKRIGRMGFALKNGWFQARIRDRNVTKVSVDLIRWDDDKTTRDEIYKIEDFGPKQDEYLCLKAGKLPSGIDDKTPATFQLVYHTTDNEGNEKKAYDCADIFLSTSLTANHSVMCPESFENPDAQISAASAPSPPTKDTDPDTDIESDSEDEDDIKPKGGNNDIVSKASSNRSDIEDEVRYENKQRSIVRVAVIVVCSIIGVIAVACGITVFIRKRQRTNMVR